MGARRLGGDVQPLADLGVGQALGDEPGYFEFADRERPPRFVLQSTAAACPRQVGRPREKRSLPIAPAVTRTSAMTAAASAWRFIRMRHWARSSRAPRPSQIRRRSSQPRMARSSDSRAADSEPAARPDEPIGMAEGGSGDRFPGRSRCSRARVTQALGVVWPPRGDERPRAGHDERDEERPLARGAGDLQGLLAARDSGERVASLQIGLREPPQGRQDELDFADPPTGRPATRRASAGPRRGGRDRGPPAR